MIVCMTDSQREGGGNWLAFHICPSCILTPTRIGFVFVLSFSHTMLPLNTFIFTIICLFSEEADRRSVLYSLV